MTTRHTPAEASASIRRRGFAEPIAKGILGKDEWNRRGWKGQDEAITLMETRLAEYEVALVTEIWEALSQRINEETSDSITHEKGRYVNGYERALDDVLAAVDAHSASRDHRQGSKEQSMNHSEEANLFAYLTTGVWPQTVEIDQALGDGYEWVRSYAAKNPSATPTQIDRALGDENPVVRAAAARNPSVSDANLDKALGDEVREVRTAAARNPACSPAQIDRALGDEVQEVRRRAAKNPSASHDNLDRALGDEDEEVRAAAISNPAATPAQIDRALADEHPWVRAAAASNPACSPTQIDRALEDEDLFVRRYATGNPSASESQAGRALRPVPPSWSKGARGRTRPPG